jgi:NAD(P)H-hydrate epimerase
MTVGGTGDVLSGVVAALMSKDVPPFNAAVAGAFINGAAGDSVYAEKGYHLEPSDLITEIPKIIEEASSGRMRKVNY